MRREDAKWALLYVLLAVAVAVLVVTGGFSWFNNELPYLAGFVQFVIFASAGELLSVRMLEGKWEVNKASCFKAICWGFSGLLVTLAFRIFSEGTQQAMAAGLLPFYGNTLALAFFTSCTINYFFAPLQTALMRVCSNYADLHYTQGRSITVRDAVNSVDWGEVVNFTIFKTIPVFWIPINTLGFLLPVDYRIVFAAMLSLVFGVLLTILKLRERKRKENG